MPMNYSSTQIGRDQMSPKECDIIVSATKYPSAGRTPSFSSSSSSFSSSSSSLGSSYFQDNSPLSPAAAKPLRLSGVPFSWEYLPGIPKKLQNHKKKESIKLLPLPPPATPRASNILNRKKASAAASAAESFREDPFFTALVECSKDYDNDDDYDQESGSKFWSGAKLTRSISDRFGFINLYTCCKRTSCAVSESITHRPRPTRTANYGLINRRSR